MNDLLNRLRIVHSLGHRLQVVVIGFPPLFAVARSVNALRRMCARWIRWSLLSSHERRRDTVTISTLGNHRFGNQLFQYMFIKTYGIRHDLRMEITPWMGEHLFGLREARLTRALPEVREKFEHDVDDTIIPNAETPFRNVDFRGYFQYHTSYFAPFKDDIRAWFRPVGLFAERADEAWSSLAARGKTVVGLHIRRGLRRGEWGFGYFFITPSNWCVDWLQSIWPTLRNPVLFVATDAPEMVKEIFSEYEPVIASDLGVSMPRFQFFLDFYLMTRCDLLAIANSTFSFAASMLNQRASAFVRPVLTAQRFVPYDPWNSKPLIQDQTVEDHPDIPGITWPEPSS